MIFGKVDALKREYEAGRKKVQEEVVRLRRLLKEGDISQERRFQIYNAIDKLIGVKETQIRNQNGRMS